jgi:hypothetical protein
MQAGEICVVKLALTRELRTQTALQRTDDQSGYMASTLTRRVKLAGLI